MYNSQYYTCEQIDERLLQGYVDDYNTQTGQSLTKEQFLTKLGNIFDKETVIDNTAVNIGYFICDTAAGTAAKAITAAGYALFQGGSIKVKFLNRNTAGSATLNINSQGAKALYYGGKAVSASNSWDNGEVVEIYYDGTSYYANNVEGNFKDGIFDISAYNLTEGQPTKYDTLAEALGTNGNNVPPIFRKGGMQIKYVSTSDNKYVQYRLMSGSFNTTVANWQGIDDEPTAGSDNLVKSGGVKYEELRQTFNVADFFNIHKYIRPSDHQPVDNDNYRCTDYIKVKQGDIIGYRLTTVYSCGICLYSDKSFTSYISTLVESGLDITEGTVTIPQDGYILCCTRYGDIDNSYIYFAGTVSEKIAKLRKADEGLQENINEQSAAITSLRGNVNEQFATDELLIANSLKRNNISSSDFTRDVYIRPSDGYIPSSNSTKCTGFIPVVAGDVIKYKLFATGSLTAICALYSEADATKFVSMLLTVPNEGLYEGTITIPSNGYIVVQNGNSYSSPYIAFKDVLDDKLDALDAESEKITTHHVDSPMVCVFHDNYSRTMQNWEIGQNSAAGSTQNTYSEVNNLSQYDDGLRVDDGATFVVNSSRNIPFSLRKLNVSVDDDFVIETNVPSIANGRVCFGFDVIDIDNFTLLYVQESSSNRYQVILQQIINRSFGDAVTANIYKAKAEVLSFCFIGSNIFIKLDDTVSAVMNRPVGMGKDIHIAAYKSIQTHFDFVNVFNYSYERTFNPNYLIDSGVSEIPTITTSANSGGYTIENTNVHYEGYADKFHLTPNDPEIHNGIRAERSVDTLISSNLRNFKVDFDVYIPSSDTEDNLGDIMCQMHDRDGSVARGKVPFILRYQNGKLTLSIYSTHVPQATTFITGLNNYELCSIAKDTWVHVEFEIKERYEKNQHPLTVVKVDGKVCYVSHEANCFNDIVPSELQYGIYKNASEWGTGVTERNRFFDNLIINYH